MVVEPLVEEQGLVALCGSEGSRLVVGEPDLHDARWCCYSLKPADVLAWVHGIGRSGRTPSSTTIGARIACLSSFYRFLIRMVLVVSNPCDVVERPRAIQSVARGYSADEVRRLLAVAPDNIAGRRDRAIPLTLVLTGRRRAEVIGLSRRHAVGDFRGDRPEGGRHAW